MFCLLIIFLLSASCGDCIIHSKFFPKNTLINVHIPSGSRIESYLPLKAKRYLSSSDLILKDDENENHRRSLSSLLKSIQENKLFTKENISKLGLSVLLSYGFVSNMNSITGLILSWIIFGKATKQSPLAPGQWKGFLAVYAGIWAANNILRPLRVSLAILISPALERFVLFIQKRTGLRRSFAFGVAVFFCNILGTTTYLVVGLTLATSLAGVPLLYKPPPAI